METGAHVLVVDDHPNITDMVATVLRFHGFRVTTAGTVSDALRLVATAVPDVVVLDVGLPDGDGLAVCRSLRERGDQVGIVLLTARDTPQDTVSGLAFGADDYVTKPFSVDVLVARVRAVLRRTGAREERPGAGVLRVGDLELDEGTCRASRAGHPVELSPTEYRLLRHLMVHAGRVLGRRELLEAVWGYDFGGASNVVDTYVGYLRRKLDPWGGPVIETRRGFGYLMPRP